MQNGGLVLCIGSGFDSLLWPFLDELGRIVSLNSLFYKHNANPHLQGFVNAKNTFKSLWK